MNVDKRILKSPLPYLKWKLFVIRRPCRFPRTSSALLRVSYLCSLEISYPALLFSLHIPTQQKYKIPLPLAAEIKKTKKKTKQIPHPAKSIGDPLQVYNLIDRRNWELSAATCTQNFNILDRFKNMVDL